MWRIFGFPCIFAFFDFIIHKVNNSTAMSSSWWIACCFVLIAVIQNAKSAPTNSTAYFDAYYCDTISPGIGISNWTADSTSQLFNDFFFTSTNRGLVAPVYCHNFNFNIPRDAVISALSMQHSRYYTTQPTITIPVQDVAGTFIVNNTASSDFSTNAVWPQNTSEVFNTACCSLWGFTDVQPSLINDPSFGVQLLVATQGGSVNNNYNLYILNMSITVFYDDCEGTSRCDSYTDTPYCINGGCNNCTADLSFCATVNSSLPYCNPMTGMCEVQPPMSPPVSTPEASNAPQNGNEPSTQQQPSSAPQSNDSPMNQPLSPTRAPARRISDASKMMSTSVILVALIGGLFMLV